MDHGGDDDSETSDLCCIVHVGPSEKANASCSLGTWTVMYGFKQKKSPLDPVGK